jgi:monovalent cation/hydrogen antiporter
MLAFIGVRGIVSLAATLAIPPATSAAQPFPYRDLILLLTFASILITLVVQGLISPRIIQKLGLSHAVRKEREVDRAEEHGARAEAVIAAIGRLDGLATERKLSLDLIERVRAQQLDRLERIKVRSDGYDSARKSSELHDEVEYLLIAAERTRTNDLFAAAN